MVMNEMLLYFLIDDDAEDGTPGTRPIFDRPDHEGPTLNNCGRPISTKEQ